MPDRPWLGVHVGAAGCIVSGSWPHSRLQHQHPIAQAQITAPECAPRPASRRGRVKRAPSRVQGRVRLPRARTLAPAGAPIAPGVSPCRAPEELAPPSSASSAAPRDSSSMELSAAMPCASMAPTAGTARLTMRCDAMRCRECAAGETRRCVWRAADKALEEKRRAARTDDETPVAQLGRVDRRLGPSLVPTLGLWFLLVVGGVRSGLLTHCSCHGSYTKRKLRRGDLLRLQL